MSVLHGQTDETRAQAIRDAATNGIEGTNGIDKVTGTSGNDMIWAGNGNDVVKAGAGNDTIFNGGGDGRDIMDGGAGADIFVNYNLGISGPRDQIKNFQDDLDMIRLVNEGLDFDLQISDVDVRYNLHHSRAIVTVDSNNDGQFTKADWSIEVLGQPGMNLTASDFSIVNS